MIIFDPTINPPKEYMRYLVFDKTGWCIGDCFYGWANYSYYNYDSDSRIKRIDAEKKCWRYSHSEDEVKHEVSFCAELPSICPKELREQTKKYKCLACGRISRERDVRIDSQFTSIKRCEDCYCDGPVKEYIGE